jgi:hypothetical protein
MEGTSSLEIKLLFCVIKSRILQKCHPADGIETTTAHLILLRKIQAKVGDVIQTAVPCCVDHLFKYLVKNVTS